MSREIKFRLWLPTAKKMAHALSIRDWMMDAAKDGGAAYLEEREDY
jgi:hypothetical protein